MEIIPNGVWPTMLTPFTENGQLDWHGLEQLIEWYIGKKVAGLFAVCQSSEMFHLSLAERAKLARVVTQTVKGRIPVIAAGQIADSLAEQIEEIRQIAAAGIDAFVILSNRLARADEPDAVWRENAERIVNRFPDLQFGIYEAPYPYKRLLSPELLRWCAATGRFLFLKDTSCDLRQMREKLAAVHGTCLKIFNANSATLWSSLQSGISGYSGVMSNFFPDLYVWLVANWAHNPAAAETVQNFIGAASLAERQAYPVNAKYYLQREGLPIAIHCRARDARQFSPAERLEVEQLAALYRRFKAHEIAIKDL
jgi:4-hydroxy-tetrahydrodipicolinate synthase